MEEKILISVIIPVFNVEKYLAKCIDSIIGQTYQNLEIILINDGSTDCSSAICDDYADKDKRIKVVHKENEGVSSARNLGLEIFKGDFISFLDADDWLESNAFEQIIECIKKNNVDSVIFEYNTVYENNKYKHKNYNDLNGLMSVEKAIECTISPINRFVWSKVFSRKIIQGVKFDTKIHFGEDTLFACQVLVNAQSVFYLAKPIHNYFQSSDSVTRMNFNPRIFTGVDAYRELVELCQARYPNLIDVAQSAYKNLMANVLKTLLNNKEYADFKYKKKELMMNIRCQLYIQLLSSKISFRMKVKFIVGAYFPLLLGKV